MQPRLAEARPRFGASTSLIPAYEGASQSRRVRSWTATSEGPNTVIFGSGDILRARSHDQVRKNPWASKGLRSYVANAIGTGIKPQSRHPKPEIRAALHKAWKRWCDEADADGQTDFYGLQALSVRSMGEGGEGLARFRTRLPQDGLSVPLQLQLLEAEHLPVMKNETAPNSGNIVRAGIEFDRIGRRVAYHLYREHPSDISVLFQANSQQTVRLNASDVIHLYQPLRPGQLRGEPWFAPSLVRLWDIDKTDDAHLVKHQIANMFAGFITKNALDDSLLGENASDVDADNVPIANLESGTMQELLPGEDIKFSQPPGGGEYEQFIRPQLRAVAAGLGITYEMLTGDLTGVNYSSIRAGILEFRRSCEQLQYFTIAFQFCRRVWRRWCDAAAFVGVIDSRDYLANRGDYWDVDWICPGWDWVDPEKEVAAKKESVRCGFESRSKIVNGLGYDPEVMDEEIASDNKRADDQGLIYDSDARKTAATAAGRPKADNAATGSTQGANASSY